MEELLFKQSFNYARIQVFKNYSNRLHQNIIKKTIEVETPASYDAFVDEIKPKFSKMSIVSHPTICSLRLYVKEKKKINYFYTKTPTDSFFDHRFASRPEVHFEPINLFYAEEMRDRCYETTKDRQIKRHYNNPFSSIEIIRVERWIKRDGDKITIKKFTQSRNRNINNIYFSKSTISTTVTFNLHTGNFTIIVYEAGRKIKLKHFYCNAFNALKVSLPAFYNITEGNITKTSPLYKEFIETFDTIQFQLAIAKVLGLTEISFGSTSEILSANFVSRWVPRFAEIKKIKLPNNSDRLLTSYYPTEKYLKKNNYKLVAAILDRFEVKSKITIKILHQYPHVDIVGLVRLCRLFGEDYPKYLGNINECFFKPFSDGIALDDLAGKRILLDKDERPISPILNSEKESLVHIINDACSYHAHNGLGHIYPYPSSRNIVDTFIDHIKIMDRIKPYYPTVQLNARKWQTFNQEHSLYSGYERSIKKGYCEEVIFEPEFIRAIEKPIEITVLNEPPIMYLPDVRDRIAYEKEYANFPVSATRRVFEPVLLKSSQEYDDEGVYMNHCVAGYINNTDWSIIVSLRLGDERVTNEFTIKDRRPVQSKYFSNQKPPDYFTEALNKLYERIKTVPFSLKPIDKKRVPLVINGVEVLPDPTVVHTVLENHEAAVPF